MKFRNQESRQAELDATVRMRELDSLILTTLWKEMHERNGECTFYRSIMEKVSEVQSSLVTYKDQLRKEWKAHWGDMDDAAVKRAIGEHESDRRKK